MKMPDERELEERSRSFQSSLEERGVGPARDLLEDLLDDDFALILVYPILTVMGRDEWLANVGSYEVHSYEVEERVVDVDGDCAAILHRATMKATVHGQDRSGVFIISDLWRKRDGSWRLWRRHSTPVSAGELPVASG